jgi:hypothetical protein
MSNPFEIPAPEPTVNAPSARAGANPFEAQVRERRVKVARWRRATRRRAREDEVIAGKR